MICFYKNLPLSGFHPIVHLYITECSEFLLWYPILVYQSRFFCIFSVFPKMTCRHIPLSWHVRDHLEHLQIQQMQWRDRLAQSDSCRTIGCPNYRFLSIPGGSRSTWTLPDVWTWTICPRFRRQSFLYSKVCIETESLLCVFVYNFLSSLVHKNSAKFSIVKMVMHFQMVYLQSSHLCAIYGQISTTVMFVNNKCPW